MNSPAYRNLRDAIESREPVTAKTLAAVVQEMNSLPQGSEQRRTLHATLRAYAAYRTATGRPATGTVQVLGSKGTSPRQSSEAKQRVAKLRQRAAAILAEGQPKAKLLTAAQRKRKLGLAILEAEEAGVR